MEEEVWGSKEEKIWERGRMERGEEEEEEEEGTQALTGKTGTTD